MYNVLDTSGDFADSALPGTWRCQVHRGCVHNEITGLVGRVLGEVPEPDRTSLVRLRKTLRRIGRIIRAKNVVSKVDRRVIVEQYTGAKRSKYDAALESLLETPVEKRDARVTAFVKAEKRKEDDEKDPRIIQFRTPRYNLELATYLKPFEHALLAYRGPRRGLRPSRVFAKGQTQVERAGTIRRKWDQFTDPVCVSFDARRFDKHVSADVLKLEHGVYQSFYPNDSLLSRLLSYQVANKGRTMGGIKYKVKGNRMSGDYNTGMGNCLIAGAMVESCLEELGFRRWDYYSDSDDVLVFIERSDLPMLLEGAPRIFLGFGHELTVDNIAFEFPDILHCQARPLLVNGVWKMVRTPMKVISQAFSGYKHFQNAKGGMRVLKSTAQCELVLNSGVPVLQSLSQRILELLSEHRFARLDVRDAVVWRSLCEVRGRDYAWREAAATEVTEETRRSFERSFGMTTEEQLHWEQFFGSLSFSNIDLAAMKQRHLPDPLQNYF